MTNRTASLFLLFAIATIATGVVVALGVTVATRFGISGPWLLPVLANASYVAVFFFGRQYILPEPIAHSRLYSLLTLTGMMALTSVVAGSIVWLLAAVFHTPLRGAIPMMAVYFVVIFVAIGAMHRALRRTATRVP